MLPQKVKDSLARKSVVVTGGTGLIGRQVVGLLVDAGADVTTVSLDKLNALPGTRHVYGDLADLRFCRDMTKDADLVCHLAGIKGSIEVTKSKPASFFVPLLMMNTNVLEACRVNEVEKVVYTSSIGAYGSAEVFRESDDLEATAPMDMYPGWAKRMAELQVRAYQIQYGLSNFAVVRLSNVYGPGDNFDPANAMVIPSLMARIAGGERPLKIWGDGSAVRDFAFSRDIAEGILLALHHGTGGKYVNLGSGEGVTIRTLVETLRKVTKFEYEFDTTKSSGFPKRVMDITLARRTLGFSPSTSLEDGLRETWDWYTKHKEEHLAKVNYFR